MKYGVDRSRRVATAALLMALMGCQFLKKKNDAGTTTTTPTATADTGTVAPVALPNPTVAPLPTAPTPDAGAVAANPPPAVVVDAGTAAAPPSTPPPTAAAEDSGAAPSAAVDPHRHGHGGIRNYCKDHPGAMNPATGSICPNTM